MSDFYIVTMVIKNGKVDNLIVEKSEIIGIAHARNMIRDYQNEEFSQIVVYKHYIKDNMNEKIFEYLPEDREK